MKNKLLTLIIPFYNEEENVEIFLKKTVPLLQSMEINYELLCVDDGSHDDTFLILKKQKKIFPEIKILSFSRNFGKEIAITAGFQYSKGDAVIPIDSDLQHPPETILEMLKLWERGNKVVLAKRKQRNSESIFSKIFSKKYYQLFNKVSKIKLPENIGDFRLLDREVVNELNKLNERERFMKGLFAWIGFESITIEYEEVNRQYGKSKFNLFKLWSFALEGIFNFSSLPIKIWSYLGFSIALIGFVYGTIEIIKSIIFGTDVAGYTSTIAIVLFLGGIQLIGIGLLGEYIARIFVEVKQRPLFVLKYKDL